jgi:broad specificity phosphatase PhoE
VLILVRHGQTTANAGGLLVGRMDSPLTDLGRRQAHAAAGAVRRSGRPIARVLSSPLSRARDSAAALGLPVEVDDRWIELDYGEFDGRPLRAMPEDAWATWRSDPSFVPAGGESLIAVGARVRDACQELAGLAIDEDVIVFSHVSPIKAAIAWTLGVDESTSWRMHLDTASICRIGISPAGPSLHSFNESTHLAGLTAAAPTSAASPEWQPPQAKRDPVP